MNSFDGIYSGIVVQNNDPEELGRVKIWIPDVSPILYESLISKGQDKNFRFPGKNLQSDISLDILKELRRVLPWADQCSPIMGESTPIRYHGLSDTSSHSDSPVLKNRLEKVLEYTGKFSESYLNEDGIGEKPAKIFETESGKVHDAFVDNEVARKINPLGYEYKPSSYSNSAKGMFSIPNVGSQVWVQFKFGNPNFPIYFGVSFSGEDYKSIFKQSPDGPSHDYPGDYENISKGDTENEETSENSLYRNKMVLNQKGGTIEIVNSDFREKMKFTHFGGGFIEFNNQTMSVFSPKNCQTLILRDAFKTVRGDESSWTDGDFEMVVRGNSYRKIGNFNFSAYKSCMDISKEIHDLKKLFEIQRDTKNGSFASISHMGASSPSPSTQDGIWSPNTEKEKIKSKILEKIIDLSEAEKKLGFGGNEIRQITKNRIETVGLLMNNLESFRVDLIGKLSNYGVAINDSGVWIKKEGSPLLEYVHVDGIPGGNYYLTVGNGLYVAVGSGGIEQRTTGRYRMHGGILTLSGKQVSIASEHEVNIDGGKRLALKADILTLEQRDGKQVSVQGNFGISKNLAVLGGAHIEGEAYLQHLTCPVEFQSTEETSLQNIDCTITNIVWSGANVTFATPGTGTITGGTLTGKLTVPAHSHYFKNIPITFRNDKTEVRVISKISVSEDATVPADSAVRDDGMKSVNNLSNTKPSQNNTPAQDV